MPKTNEKVIYSYKKITFDEFTASIVKGGMKKFTPIAWLLGAGVSASANIPLASGVCKRIMIIEYLTNTQSDLPWKDDGIDDLSYDEDELIYFFDWYKQQESKEVWEDTFIKLHDDALTWLNKQEHFKDIKPQDPICYQLLFEHRIQTIEIQRQFLSALIKHADGVNLAHLALAGILKDHPNLSSTVFTTNFDDLLLKALLSLNHNARIFGESGSKDETVLNPDYPQIVYLHGKHTDYRLINFEKQIKENALSNELVKREIERHITNSHLVVVGYAGWDDIAMKSLEKWKSTRKMMKGNIYWVPYRDESDLSDDLKRFLNSFEDNRVFVVENKKENEKLDADSFFLALCDFFNNKNTKRGKAGSGFSSYRKDILNNAKNQHNFVLDQLKKHPNFNPQRVIDLVGKTHELLKEDKLEEAELTKQKAIFFMNSDDLPDALKADAFQAMGLLEHAQYKLKSAKEYLEKAIGFYKKIEEIDTTNIVKRSASQVALAEILIMEGDFYQARFYINNSLYIHDTLKIYTPETMLRAKLLRIYIHILKSSLITTEEDLKSLNREIIDLGLSDDIRLSASVKFISGTYFFLIRKFIRARSFFTSALEIYEKNDNATCFLVTKARLAEIELRDLKFDDAERHLKECITGFIKLENELGKANILNLLGDLYYQKDELINSLTYYNQAIIIFREGNFNFNLMNCLVDVAIVHRELGQEKEEQHAIEEVKKVLETNESKYIINKINEEFNNSKSIEEEVDTQATMNRSLDYKLIIEGRSIISTEEE